MNLDPSLLDVKLLRLLDQLYLTRSVTRSAEALGQSQPTVSIWLARLRRQFNDPLFVRTAEGMLPTPRTDALLSGIDSFGNIPTMEDRYQRMCRHARQLEIENQELREDLAAKMERLNQFLATRPKR